MHALFKSCFLISQMTALITWTRFSFIHFTGVVILLEQDDKFKGWSEDGVRGTWFCRVCGPLTILWLSPTQMRVRVCHTHTLVELHLCDRQMISSPGWLWERGVLFPWCNSWLLQWLLQLQWDWCTMGYMEDWGCQQTNVIPNTNQNHQVRFIKSDLCVFQSNISVSLTREILKNKMTSWHSKYFYYWIMKEYFKVVLNLLPLTPKYD